MCIPEDDGGIPDVPPDDPYVPPVIPPTEVCADPTALNYGGALPCEYPPEDEPVIPDCATDQDCIDMYGPGYVCVNGECVLSGDEVLPGCVFDGDCVETYGPGYTCVEGECVEPTGCRTNIDCPSGQVCIDQVCVPGATGLMIIGQVKDSQGAAVPVQAVNLAKIAGFKILVSKGTEGWIIVGGDARPSFNVADLITITRTTQSRSLDGIYTVKVKAVGGGVVPEIEYDEDKNNSKIKIEKAFEEFPVPPLDNVPEAPDAMAWVSGPNPMFVDLWMFDRYKPFGVPLPNVTGDIVGSSYTFRDLESGYYLLWAEAAGYTGGGPCGMIGPATITKLELVNLKQNLIGNMCLTYGVLVIDKMTGLPLSGVGVAIADQQYVGYTDANGMLDLPDTITPPDNNLMLKADFVKVGYVPMTQYITTAQLNTVEMDHAVMSGRLLISTILPDGSGYATRVGLFALGSTYEIHEARTGDTGVGSFSDIPFGIYELVVVGDDYYAETTFSPIVFTADSPRFILDAVRKTATLKISMIDMVTKQPIVGASITVWETARPDLPGQGCIYKGTQLGPLSTGSNGIADFGARGTGDLCIESIKTGYIFTRWSEPWSGQQFNLGMVPLDPNYITWTKPDTFNVNSIVLVNYYNHNVKYNVQDQYYIKYIREYLSELLTGGGINQTQYNTIVNTIISEKWCSSFYGCRGKEEWDKYKCVGSDKYCIDNIDTKCVVGQALNESNNVHCAAGKCIGDADCTIDGQICDLTQNICADDQWIGIELLKKPYNSPVNNHKVEMTMSSGEFSMVGFTNHMGKVEFKRAPSRDRVHIIAPNGYVNVWGVKKTMNAWNKIVLELL